MTNFVLAVVFQSGSFEKYILFQVNNRIKSDLLELAEVDGSCMSLHDTVMYLSGAIKGLNFIKQQWTGKSRRVLKICFTYLRQDLRQDLCKDIPSRNCFLTQSFSKQRLNEPMKRFFPCRIFANVSICWKQNGTLPGSECRPFCRNCFD